MKSRIGNVTTQKHIPGTEYLGLRSDVGKLKYQYKVRIMPKKRLPAIVNTWYSCMGENNDT